MKKRMYCVRDNKTCFWNPVEGYNDMAAVRDFQNLVDQSTMIQSHLGDFDLFYVGEFDNDTGMFEPVNPVIMICSAGSVFMPKGVKPDEKS